MRCPKCKHVQKNAVECEACGVIFERYIKFQEKKKEKEAVEAQAAEKKGGIAKIIQLVLLVVVVAGGTYYFTGYRPQSKNTVVDHSPVPQPAELAVKPIAPQVVPVDKSVPASDSAKENSSYNTIEKARNATVSIETPWGTGSGFFISKDYVITNKHVVEMDELKVAEFREKVEKNRKLIDLEQQKIREYRSQLRQLSKGPARSQLSIIINDMVANLDKVLPQQQEAEARLEKLEEKVRPSSIKIILSDGSEHVANYLLVSENNDLALMALSSGKDNFLKKSPERNALHQGDKVYTIGSPVGLRHTVTAGVFSGYRKDESDNKVYLQTDAAINPGNSGGPLIDENGYVWGVNTMILRGTEGIGFAIPMSVVYEEFGSSLY
ncbi:trypsin-like peptidase domain-containing protein [Desulforhopalus sp. IMCC35007]|uniref:trypsin-like peptidase domain-containing protein n=1 Tax=Desulforhopalus sp. IMCC35007 TaxID=2569543 RepID=UPI0010AECCCE|nr:trypsin-like peptidase domain-containing protein [Desulforhopalus sp. IMCC35007]TKB06941.1 trypsin-like serine protease [Desulforhopalus sp. IMCC35007]